MENVKISVFRFNPEIDARAHYDNFEITVPDNATVLDAMHAVKENLDGTLTFRRSCRSNICGSCAVRVNGRGILMCKTQIKEVAIEGKIVVEPLSNLRIIRDLVVDMDVFWEKLKSVQPWLSTGYPNALPEKEFRQSDAVVKELDQTTDCIMCGICYSICESIHCNQNYFGPHVMAKTYRFVADDRDALGSARVARLIQLTGDAIWLCVDCHGCEEFCPQKVKVLESGYQLRRTACELGHCHPGLIAAKSDLGSRAKLLEISEFENTMRGKYGLKLLSPKSESAMKLMAIITARNRKEKKDPKMSAGPAKESV